jgi:hypothetical protein
MFKISTDIEYTLQKKYNDANIPMIVNDLFDELIRKTLFDGSTNIREFGKFISYKIEDENGTKIRFKFVSSRSLKLKLTTDTYILDKMPIKAKHKFDEKNEEKCKDKQQKKKLNKQTEDLAIIHGNQRTIENICKFEIEKLIEDEQ